MRRIILLTGLTSLLVALVTMVAADPAAMASGSKLFVAPGTTHSADTSCSAAGYNSIQSAVTAARSGNTIEVCTGVYAEQVKITKSLTVKATAGAIIRPTTALVNAADEDTALPIVAIVAVEPGARVNISGLTVDGSLIESNSFGGCADNFIGILYQANATGTVSGTIKGATVENTNSTACQGDGYGDGIFVQAGSSGTPSASMHLIGNSVSGYGKNGITCVDVGTVCNITHNKITTSPTAAVAQNGIQTGFGAVGPITNNTITGNFWTAYASDTNPQPQSDYGAGILLYGAGINASGAVSKSTSVSKNTLSNNQIGVQVVDSEASVARNTITESSPGITDSIGVYGLGCDAYCGYFNADNGKTLTMTASMGQTAKVTSNKINFTSTPSGSYGIWLGDNSWTAPSGYYPPAGSERVHVSGNSISGVANSILIGGGAKS